MLKLRLFFIAILSFYLSSAQYTEIINSKRPGFSDSPYSVGTNVYQVETGFFYKKIGNYLYQVNGVSTQYNSQAFGTDMLLRVGKFFERLELDVDMSFGYEKRNYRQPEVISYDKLGFSKFTVGAKYLIYMPTYTDKSKEIRSWKKRNAFDKKRLIPAVGVYAGLNTNLLTDLQKDPEGMSPRIAVFTQNNISDKFIFLTNFIADKFTTDQRVYSYILTATYSINDQVSIFGENQGFFPANSQFDLQWGLGAGYLFAKNFQVDLSTRFIIDEYGDHTFWVGTGLSYRVDRHVDKFKSLDDNGNVTAEENKGGFFSRLFGKNKADKQRKVKKIKAKKRKVKKLKPTKKEKELAKKAKQQEKEAKKREKDEAKNYKKNYEPPKKENPVDDNN
ncbi:MAG: transporter [Flavobacteriaceae bacterium]|nr:transporter [Flavobacteriaceae bacterium]